MFEAIGNAIINGFSMPIMNWWASHPALFGFMETVMGLAAALIVVGLWWIQIKYLQLKKKNQTES